MVQRIEQLHAAQAAAIRASADPDEGPELNEAALVGCFCNDLFGTLELVSDGKELAAVFHGLRLQAERLDGSRYLLSHPYTGDLVVRFELGDGDQVESLSVAPDSPPVERRFRKHGATCADGGCTR